MTPWIPDPRPRRWRHPADAVIEPPSIEARIAQLQAKYADCRPRPVGHGRSQRVLVCHETGERGTPSTFAALHGTTEANVYSSAKGGAACYTRSGVRHYYDPAKPVPAFKPIKRRPVRVGATEYPSTIAAARDLGIREQYMAYYLRAGRLPDGRRVEKAA
jgi:hypothetical protein